MKETGMFKRLLALVLLVCMVVSAMPVLSSAEEERYGYLIIQDSTIKNRVVNFRPSMKASGDYLDQLPEFTVVKILDEQTKNGAKWYHAQNLANNQKGYFLGSYVQEMTAIEIMDWQVSGKATYNPAGGSERTTVSIRGTDGYIGYVVTTQNPTYAYIDDFRTIATSVSPFETGRVVEYYAEAVDLDGYNWAQIQVDGVPYMLRSDSYEYLPMQDVESISGKASALSVSGKARGELITTAASVVMYLAPGGNQLTQTIPQGTTVPYYVIAENVNGANWALVIYNGVFGYISSVSYSLISSSATPAPEYSEPEEIVGYIRLVLDSVNVRSAPEGTILTEKDADKLPLGLVLPIYGEVLAKDTASSKYNWALVSYNGQAGYIRSDCYLLSDVAGNLITPSPIPESTPVAGDATPSPTPAPVYADGTFGRTTDEVFFRKVMSKNGDYWAYLPKDWVVEVLDSDTKGDILWYKVRGGTPSNPNRSYTGYIHSDYLTVFAGSGATDAPTAGVSGYAVVIVDGINLRATAGGTAISVLRSNTVVNVISVPAGSSANDWYYVELNGEYGYLPATALRELLTTELENFTLPAAPAPTVTPTPTPAYTGTGYVKLILDKVNLRKTPGGTVLTPSDASKLPLGLVLAYTEGPTEKISGYNWVKVTYGGQTGYIRSDCYEQCNADGTSVTPSATPTVAPDAGATSYIRLIKGGVNVRTSPDGQSYGQLSKGTILPCYGTQQKGSATWYIVYSSKLNTSGYVLSTMAVPCDAAGIEIKPTIAPTTAPDNGGSGSTTPVYTGYVATNISAVWVRSAPETDASTVGKVQNKGTVLPQIGPAVTQLGSPYAWYPVQLSADTQGYIRSDCVFELAQWQLDYYTAYGTCPTPTPGPATPPPGNSEYVKVFGGSLWVRKTPSTKAATVGQLADNSVTKYYSKKVVGGITWYEVKVDGSYGWIHGNYARILTNAEYYAWKGTEAPTSTPTAMPDPSTFSDLGLTIIERVKIRAAASMDGKQESMIYTEGSEFTYLGSYTTPTATNQYYWFKIKYQGVIGWVRGDCVRILTTEEKQMYQIAGNPDAPKEASYRTLSKGSTGEDVTALQNKLVEKGYLTGTFTSGYYDSATETAVIAFQRANSLTTDGLAGELTQHALFNTVPEGTYDGSSTSVTLFPVEYIDWYTGGIQNLWKAGTVAIITDVKTGISFRAQRLYGSNHADAEPLTVEDTDAICRIYGVSDPQDISDYMDEMQSWRRRPLWVTIGNRTFAASMYGVPHNYSGDRIPDNGYTGQFCVHFTNSKTHGSGSIPARVDYDYPENDYYGHQSAIKDAYKQSISGNK